MKEADTNTIRVQELEKTNKQLQKVVGQLTRRIQQVEQQSKRAYHTSQANGRMIHKLQRAVTDALSKLRINQ